MVGIRISTASELDQNQAGQPHEPYLQPGYTAAIFDIGCGTRVAPSPEYRQTGRNNITRALCHQLRVGTVFSATVCRPLPRRKAGLNRARTAIVNASDRGT